MLAVRGAFSRRRSLVMLPLFVVALVIGIHQTSAGAAEHYSLRVEVNFVDFPFTHTRVKLVGTGGKCVELHAPHDWGIDGHHSQVIKFGTIDVSTSRACFWEFASAYMEVREVGNHKVIAYLEAFQWLPRTFKLLCRAAPGVKRCDPTNSGGTQFSIEYNVVH